MRAAGATPRHAGARWVRAVAFVLSVSSGVHAEVTLAPSPAGYLGAFLLAGPLPPRTGPADVSTPLPTAGSPVGERLGWLTWSLRDGGIAPLDLNQRFGPKERRAALAAVLSLSEPLDGWLLVAADGYVTVGVDGTPLWTRPTPHARGSGWDPVSLTLPSGDHTLTILLERRGGPWNVEARLLGKTDLEPPRGAVIRLPGTTDADAAQLAQKLTRVEAFAGLVPSGYQPRVVVDFPRGAPLDPSLLLTVTEAARGAPLAAAMDLGGLVSIGRGAMAHEALLPAVTTDAKHALAAPDELRVGIAGRETREKVSLPDDAPSVITRALALALALARGEHPALSDRDVVSATLEEAVRDLAALADRGDPSLPAATKRLSVLVDMVLQGRDPVHQQGVLVLARRSTLDGGPDPMRVHVPRSYAPGEKRRYPLVVVLHGYTGSPASVMNAFLGTESLAPHPVVDGFVLAPSAHGDAFYRGPGETDTLDAIDWALRTYPIDPDRVSITGISMGGTGAAHFAFRYPDRFTTAAALAGYHSYFVRRDVAGKPLRAWEWMELSRWSPVSYAENGRELFLYVTQGTRDLPLVHSTSLADRYRMLGYALKEDYPEIGHDVWRIAWENAGLFPLLTARRRSPEPTRILYKTDSLRLGRRAWARVTELESWGMPARVEAAIAAKDSITVKTSGVAGLELTRPTRWVKEDTPLTVIVDGQRLAAETTSPIALRREGAQWTLGARAPGPREKKAGLEGPIRDAFSGPLAFVYGTLDPTEENAARELAEHFRGRYSGSADFPILADVAAPADLGATHALFLVGSKTSNALVRALDAELPFGIEDGAVRAFSTKIEGDADLGFVCIYPNPRHPSFYVVLVEAVSARGLIRASSLPMQLPDFIVFDSGVAPASGQQVLGEARTLGAGYFDRDWALPADFSDRIAIAAGRDGSWWNPPSEHRTPAAGKTAPPP